MDVAFLVLLGSSVSVAMGLVLTILQLRARVEAAEKESAADAGERHRILTYLPLIEQRISAQTEWIDIQDRKIKEQFDVIAGLIKERDRWKNWYAESSFLYGNAQNMLMGELERMATIAKTQVDPRILAIRQNIQGKEAAIASVPATPVPVVEPLPERPAALAVPVPQGEVAITEATT